MGRFRISCSLFVFLSFLTSLLPNFWIVGGVLPFCVLPVDARIIAPVSATHVGQDVGYSLLKAPPPAPPGYNVANPSVAANARIDCTTPDTVFFSNIETGGRGGRHPESTFHYAPLHSRGDLRFGWCNNSGINRVGPLLLHTCSGAWQRIRLSLAQAALCSRTHPTPRSEHFRLTPRPSARGFQGALEIFVLSFCGGGGTRAPFHVYEEIHLA